MKIAAVSRTAVGSFLALGGAGIVFVVGIVYYQKHFASPPPPPLPLSASILSDTLAATRHRTDVLRFRLLSQFMDDGETLKRMPPTDYRQIRVESRCAALALLRATRDMQDEADVHRVDAAIVSLGPLKCKP